MSIKLVEVARSFSMKKNLGNYESVDFFASQKAEVPEEEAEKTSEALYLFCKAECIKSLNEYLKDREAPKKPLTPEEEYTMPGFSKHPLESFPKLKKEFVKPYIKQMRDSQKQAEDDYKASGRIDEYDPDAPTHEAGSREGGKVLVDKKANTLNPF